MKLADVNMEILANSPLAKGKKELVGYYEGKEISRKEAMLAKCYECMGYFIDGKVDCKIKRCPMYQYMPYREGKVSNKLEGEEKEKFLARFKKIKTPETEPFVVE